MQWKSAVSIIHIIFYGDQISRNDLICHDTGHVMPTWQRP